jgi:AcrR family transcriptional regulator
MRSLTAATGYRLGTKPRQTVFSINFDRAGTLTGKRERILKGMLKAVGTHGYERTTVQDAIAEAGVYRQAFYDSFGDKEDCYLQALDAGSAWVELAMRDAAAGETVWRGQLRGALTGLLSFLDEQPAVGRALLVEVHAAGPRAIAKRTEAMARAAAMIDLARRESDDGAPAISAEAVVAGVLAVLHSRLAANQTSGYMRLLPELMYLAVLPFFGADAASAAMRTSGA